MSFNLFCLRLQGDLVIDWLIVLDISAPWEATCRASLLLEFSPAAAVDAAEQAVVVRRRPPAATIPFKAVVVVAPVALDPVRNFLVQGIFIVYFLDHSYLLF